jgi:hypothetical protein
LQILRRKTPEINSPYKSLSCLTFNITRGRHLEIATHYLYTLHRVCYIAAPYIAPTAPALLFVSFLELMVGLEPTTY